jgi:hypothetical protein
MTALAPRHKAAVAAAALTSSIALFDAATAATTGHYSVFAEDSGNTLALVVSDIVHGLNYAALGWVLVHERRCFAGYGRLVRGARWVLLASLAVLAIAFLVVAPALAVSGAHPAGVLGAAWGVLANVTFFGMILATVLLSLVVLRRNRLGVGGRVLRLLLPVAVATVLLGVLGSPWAHPAYVETVINLGLALVGAGSTLVVAVRHEPATAAA